MQVQLDKLVIMAVEVLAGLLVQQVILDPLDIVGVEDT